MASNYPSGSSAITGGDVAGSDTGAVVRQLNSLLRGEISATETYRMAIGKLSQEGQAAQTGLLSGIQEEHARAAQAIRDRIAELGGEASDDSGAWGVWSKLVQGAADMMGDAACLKALKEGEEHGLKDFREALDDVDAVSRQLIQNQFLPAQERHIQVLDQLLSTSTHA